MNSISPSNNASKSICNFMAVLLRQKQFYSIGPRRHFFEWTILEGSTTIFAKESQGLWIWQGQHGEPHPRRNGQAMLEAGRVAGGEVSLHFSWGHLMVF